MKTLTWTLPFVVLSLLGNVHRYVLADEAHTGEGEKDYLNHWVAEIKGGEDVAKQVALKHGFAVESPAVGLPNHYHLQHSDVPHRSKRSAPHHTRRLADDSRIVYAEQQHEKARVKRASSQNRRSVEKREEADRIARSTPENLNDPSFKDEWYVNTMEPQMDMGVKKAWKQGVSGRNVVVTILDDGLERRHPDLEANYEPKASIDLNERDDDPSPRYDPTNENKHGTRCAGEVAMIANNNVCGVGIAYNSKIGGVRMLDGKVTDALEGEAIAFPSKDVDIFSASWGPSDDGRTLELPGKAATKGIMQSISKGRNGKGVIMVWAAGNGAHYGDNCNCDGYTSNIHTLSVSSASEHGTSPWYAEKCSSTLAATFSSGNRDDRKVISADLHGQCTNEHTGTSASAPMAAGIMALVLEKNPDLTWRDAQHLVVLTSRYSPLAKEVGWYRNAVGLCVNHAFGFGLMDADELVKKAGDWKHVPEQHICRVTSQTSYPINLTSGNAIDVEIYTDGCHGQENEINFLEHVQVVFTLEYSKRGNIYAELESPSGTITPLMLERKYDKSKVGFHNWPLTSVHTWGENPSGSWRFRIADKMNDGNSGSLKGVEFVMYGTKEKPFYHDSINTERCADLPTFPANKPTLKTGEVDVSFLKILYDVLYGKRR